MLQSGRRAWRISLVGTMVSALGNGLTLPFLFVFLHGVRHLSLPLAGIIVAVGAVFAFAVAPMSGALGDRIGLGRLLVIGLVVSGVGTGLLALLDSAPGAFVAVALTTAGQSFSWPSLNGLVALQLPPQARPQAYALRFGVVNAGIGIGGLISGFVVSVSRPASFELVYLLDAAGSLLFAVIVLIGMRNSPGFTGAAGVYPDAEPRSRARRGYRHVLANRPFVGFLVCTFLFYLFGYAQLNGPWAAFATLVVGGGPQIVGIAFAVNTATIVICQLLVTRISRRWRRSRSLLSAGVFWTLAWGISATALVPSFRGPIAFVALAVSLAVFGLGETFFSVVAGALPNDLAEPELRGRYNAASSATSSVAGFVGPPLAGLLLGSAVPSSWVYVIMAGMALTAAGTVVLGRMLPPSVHRPAADETPAPS